MVKKDKLLEKAYNNPNGLNFSDFVTIMKQNKWTFDHKNGSHQIWYSPRGYRISVQNRKGKAKSYQVKQFLSTLDEDF